MDDAIEIDSLDSLREYKEVLITGGEPMLYPNAVLKMAGILSEHSDVYLYTAKYDDKLIAITEHLKGVTFTLHKGATLGDMLGFWCAQEAFRAFHGDGKTFRLALDHEITYKMLIYPYVWSMIKIKDWKARCVVPENEDLYIWEGEI